MKQLIRPGTAVDSGTGDYLRRGAQKMNANMEELYDSYGDSNILTPATGGWIDWTTSDGTLIAEIGKQYNIDSTGGPVTVVLPRGRSDLFGEGIAFRDVRGSWTSNPVTFQVAAGDSIDAGSETTISVRFTDILMTYSSPATWRWRAGQRLDRFSDTAESAIYKRQFKVVADQQTDFIDILPVEYNTSAFEVYVNGILQYFNGIDDPDSQYGSYVEGQAGITELDGASIRFIEPLSKGAIVTFVSYQKSVGLSPTTYNELALKVHDTTSLENEVEGKVVKRDLSQTTFDLNLSEFKNSFITQFQLEATEVYVNGNKLIRRGQADLILGTCSDPAFEDAASCELANETWTEAWNEYGLYRDADGKLTNIRITSSHVPDGARVSVVTYFSIIGTILGIQDIIAETDALYMRADTVLNISNTLSYSTPSQPSQATAEINASNTAMRVDDIAKLFDLTWPVGSIYENAHNPNNPRDFMGFGTWVRYAKGRFIAGHNPDLDNFGQPDPVFGANENDLDTDGNPKNTAGGTPGNRTVTLGVGNIPSLSTGEGNTFLKRNADPDAGFLKYWGSSITNLNPIASYDNEQVTVGSENPEAVDIIPPAVTAYIWVRVE